MAISVSFNGVVYSIPQVGEESWGENLTSYFVAIPQGALQKTGGAFTLTADVNFGASFGLLSRYFSTRTASPATAGVVRLAVSDSVGWRNNANSANLLLSVNGSNQLTFDGSAIYPGGITALTGDVTATGPGSVAATIANNAVTNAKFRQSAGLSVVGNATNSLANVADITAGVDFAVLGRNGTSLAFGLITNSNVDAAAAVAYSKLALTGSIQNADINASAAIAYSKLSLTDSILNADINSAAAIAYSKLALSNSILNADINASAAIAYSKLALTGSILNADINASAAIAYSKLALTGSILNADINASAAIAFSKLATLSSGNILVGSAGNVATSVAVTGDVTLSNAGVSAIGSNKVTLAMLAQVSTAQFLGRTTASTGNVESLTVTQATALLNNMVGDSGSGGTKGLVPAPASGDAAAAKFLKADGTWQAPAGVGTVTSVGLTVPTALFSVSPVSGSPVTSSGTLAPVLATQSANRIFAGPTTGAAATPTFRALVQADVPTVAMRAVGTPTGGLTGSFTTVILPTASVDTNSAYNTSTGEYTIPTTGYYTFTVGLTYLGTIVLNSEIDVKIRNGSTTLGYGLAFAGGAQAVMQAQLIVDATSCTVGDVITVQVLTTIGSANYSTTTGVNWFSAKSL